MTLAFLLAYMPRLEEAVDNYGMPVFPWQWQRVRLVE
jgi:hypothetical protein